MVAGERVTVIGIGTGRIVRVRDDGRGEAIFTVNLDDRNLTPDGLFYARRFELKRVR